MPRRDGCPKSPQRSFYTLDRGRKRPSKAAHGAHSFTLTGPPGAAQVCESIMPKPQAHSTWSHPRAGLWAGQRWRAAPVNEGVAPRRGREKSGQARHGPHDPTLPGSRDSSPRWLPSSRFGCRPCARVHPRSGLSATVSLSRMADQPMTEPGVDDGARSTTVAGAGTARQCVRVRATYVAPTDGCRRVHWGGFWAI